MFSEALLPGKKSALKRFFLYCKKKKNNKKVAMKLFEQRLSYVKMQPKSQTKVSLLRLNLEHWLLYFFLFSSPR